MLRSATIVAVAAFCFFSLFQVVPASLQCNEVYFTVDKCRNSSYIEVGGQKVLNGTNDVRIKLTGFQTEATWFCGSSKGQGRLAWITGANQIRVDFFANGTVQWTVYNCGELSQALQDGREYECSDEGFSAACPGDASSNTNCVFEVYSSTTFTDKTTTTAQVTGSIAAKVSEKVTAEISGSTTRERSKAIEVKFGKKSYVVIPAGFKFCSYSDAKRVSGKWQCSLTKFVQTKLSSDPRPCSDLPKCSKRVCVACGSSGVKSMLNMLPFAFAYVVVQIFTF